MYRYVAFLWRSVYLAGDADSRFRCSGSEIKDTSRVALRVDFVFCWYSKLESYLAWNKWNFCLCFCSTDGESALSWRGLMTRNEEPDFMRNCEIPGKRSMDIKSRKVMYITILQELFNFHLTNTHL